MKLRDTYYKLARYPWRVYKWWMIRRGFAVKGPPGIDDPLSSYYINPDDYGCKPGVVTWDYLNATYDATFPEGKC